MGRAALRAAIEEMTAGAREEGGNNRGPWVRTYLNDMAPEGSSWCATFVSWCYLPRGGPHALCLLRQRQETPAGFPGEGLGAFAGQRLCARARDVVVWWRVRSAGWQGHAGLVHHVADGMLYTIEGNRTASRRVRLCSLSHGQAPRLWPRAVMGAGMTGEMLDARREMQEARCGNLLVLGETASLLYALQ